jgi:hypothetical protein
MCSTVILSAPVLITTELVAPGFSGHLFTDSLMHAAQHNAELDLTVSRPEITLPVAQGNRRQSCDGIWRTGGSLTVTSHHRINPNAGADRLAMAKRLLLV